MSDDEKTVMIAGRLECYESAPEDSVKKQCKSCGRYIVLTGSNLGINTNDVDVKIEEADEFLCDLCGAEMLKYRGMAS